MRTFVEKPKATQPVRSPKVSETGRSGLQHNHELNPMPHLQQTMGNQAALRLLQNNATEGNIAFLNAALPQFAYNFSLIPIHPPIAAAVQKKPAVIKPGDEYGQEADLVAEQVMRMPKSQRKPTGAYESPNGMANQPGSKQKRLQTRSVQDSDTGQAATPPIAYDVPRSPGHPLDPTTRAYFELRLQHDFSSVRVHADARAAQATSAIQARAYTLGQHIVFGHGEYLPGTVEGTRLLAHELTHVVQQRQGVSLTGNTGQPGDMYERHADAVADAVVADLPAKTLLAQGPGIAGNGGGAAIQRQQTPAATVSEPVDEKDEEPLTEGELMCRAILDAAEGRHGEKTTIVSAEDIKKIQEGYPDERGIPTRTPVKNFTTCIEFAGQTFADASNVRSKALGRTSKEARRAGRLLSDTLRTMSQEFDLLGQIKVYGEAIERNKKPLENSTDRRGREQPGLRSRYEAAEKEKKKLEEARDALPGTKTGDKNHDKAVDFQIKGKQQAIRGQEQIMRQLDTAMKAIGRETEKLKARVEKLQAAYDVLDARDEALVRATVPLTSRPKPGEYILLGAGSAQSYGVKKESNVTLAKGSFKHIAVFKKSEATPSPAGKPEEKWEKWYTIDGGGVAPKVKQLYVCLTDLRVQFGEPTDPWSRSQTTLIGWIDIDKLVAGTGVAKNTGTAQPAP